MKLTERMSQDGIGVWLNHTGCPEVIPGVDGVWPRLQPVEALHYDWQDTYQCPKCHIKIVVSLVKERVNHTAVV